MIERYSQYIPAAVWVVVGALAVLFADSEFSLAAEIFLASGWLAVFVALLVPATIGMTIVTLLVPAIAGVAAFGGSTFQPVALLVGIALVVLFVFTPVSDFMVNGSSYGSEKRFLLRPTILMTIMFMFFMITSSWAVHNFVEALGNQVWLSVVGYAFLSAFIVFVGSKMMHQSFSRWLVFVPAGLVIHDPYLLHNSAMTRRQNVEHLTTAGVRTETDQTLDLTAGAPGYSSHLATKETIAVDLRDGTTTETQSIRFTPLRPGAVLKEARIRGVKTKL